jgi:hypothetical protein
VNAALEPVAPGTDLAPLFAAEVYLRRAAAADEERRQFSRAGAREKILAEKVAAFDDLCAAAAKAVDAALAVDPKDPVALNALLRLLSLTGAPRERFEEAFAPRDRRLPQTTSAPASSS